MKKKILILSNHDVLTYKFRKEVIQSLLKEGYNVILALPYGKKIDEMRKWGCKYVDMPAFSRHGTNVFKEIQLILDYIRLIKKVKPNLVLAYTIKPNLYGGIATSLLKVPFIASVTGLGTAVENDGILQKVIKCMYKLCLKNASCIFVQNNKIKKFIEERNINTNIVVVPGSGVNLEQYTLKTYPEKEEEIIFITIGRLMKDKGIDEILSAAKTIKKDYPNVRFQLIGFDDGNYKEIVEIAEKQNLIEYYGFQDDVQQWIANSHAILHASHHEGMANVLLEGAACGRPIIATNINGCKETFDEGVSGFGFKVKDSEDLARKLRNFIELPHNEKMRMGICGREKMEKEFDRNIVIDTYMKEIKSLIK